MILELGLLPAIVADITASILTRAYHETTTTVEFMFEKLERIRATITDINQSRIGWQPFGAANPQSRFAGATLPLVAIRLARRHGHTAMQNLMGQPDQKP